VQSVPSNVIASMFKFREEEFFEIEEGERAVMEQAPRVDFGTSFPAPPQAGPPPGSTPPTGGGTGS
jgi:hypothetical protein